MKSYSALFVALLVALPVVSTLAQDVRDQALFREKISTRNDKEADEIIQKIYRHFEAEAAVLTHRETATSRKVPQISVSANPWWTAGVEDSLRESDRDLRESQETLYARTLQNSSQVKVFGSLPVIRETGIREARAAFDTELFAEGMWHDDNKPVGSSLQTGGPNRFIEERFSLEAGVKKKFITGAEVTLSQNIGRVSNNSVYFTPHEQGTSEVGINIVQPLLRGAGMRYNNSVIEIARLDTQMALSEFLRQTETHLMEVNRAYWSMYLARALYLEKLRLVNETEGTVQEIESRKDLDAAGSQLLRARAAYAIRNTDTIRSEMAIRNAEARIKALVNAPEYVQESGIEFIPVTSPIYRASAPTMQNVALSALKYRPEIKQATDQLRANIIRKDMQKNELLPQINVVLSGSVGGLAGEGRVTDAWGNQFDTGEPSFGVGLVFSYPLENNLAKARYQRRQLEVRQQIEQINTTVETVLLEAKTALRELVTAERDLRGKYAAVEATGAELKSYNERKSLEVGLGDDGASDLVAMGAVPASANTSQYLERLLDSQERHSFAREEFLRSLVVYNVAFTNLERAKGTLLQHEEVTVQRTADPKNPKLPMLRLTMAAQDSSK